MIRPIIILFSFLVSALSVFAQGVSNKSIPPDTLCLTNGAKVTFHVNKLSAEADGVYSIKTREGAKIVQPVLEPILQKDFSMTRSYNLRGLNSAMMEQLVFADGFRLRFVDGKMDRSQLLLANQYKSSNSVLLAEGVIPLNESETKSLLGDEAYYLGRRVYMGQRVAGGVKAMSGAVLFFISRSILRKAYNVPFRADGHVWIRNPQWLGAFCYSSVSIFYGLGERAYFERAIQKLANDRTSFTPLTKGQYTTCALVGGGLVASGAFVMWLGHQQLMKKRTKQYGLWYDVNGNYHYAHTIANLTLTSWLVPISGALLMNLGISGITYGLGGLSGYHRLKRAKEPQLSFSPTPYGISVGLTF